MSVEGPSQDLTYKIIGGAMGVHNALGPGLKEIAYHKALSLALEKAGMSYEEEKAVEISSTARWSVCSTWTTS